MTNEVVQLRPETQLQFYDAARRALAEAVNVDEVREIRDKAVALAKYAQMARDVSLEANALEIRVRAERRVGQMMAEQRDGPGLNQGGRRPRSETRVSPTQVSPSLAQAGIDHNLAARARVLAAIPERAFETRVSNIREGMVD